MAGVPVCGRGGGLMVTVSVKGLQDLQRNLETLGKLDGLEVELDRSANAVLRTAVTNLEHMGADKSCPGLSASLEVITGAPGFSRRIGSSHESAAQTEFGTTHIPSRPWLSSALTTEKPALLKRVKELLVRKLKRGAVPNPAKPEHEE